MSRVVVLGLLLGCGTPDDLTRNGFDSVRDGSACPSFETAPEGAFVYTSVSSEWRECEQRSHAVGGSEGSTLELTLDDWAGSATIELVDWNGDVLEAIEGVTSGDVLSFEMPWSGEILVRLTPETLDAGPYSLTRSCTANCASWARGHLFLMHGLGPSEGGLPGLAWPLEDAGFAVSSHTVDAFQPTAVRARQWREHLDASRATGTWRRVHLIGHSMGGIDARYVAAQLDETHQVRSVTTLVSPHHGTIVADFMSDVLHEPMYTDLVDGILAEFFPDHLGQDPTNQVAQLSRDGMALFNATIIDREDVAYRSWAAVSCNPFDAACIDENFGEQVGPGLLPSHWLMEQLGEPVTDGLVSPQSAMWGDYLGTLPADHYDMHGGAQTPAMHMPTFIVRDANRLVALEREEAPETEPYAWDGLLGTR